MWWSYIAKVVLTSAFIVAMSELAKRSLYTAALLMALPLATVVTMTWLYIDTHDAYRAADYGRGVLLLTPPGMVFLALVPLGVRYGLDFWVSLAISIALTGLLYFVYAWALNRMWGITI
jgi:hypothetical protein